MNKIVAAFLAAVMIASLTACSSKNNPRTDETVGSGSSGPFSSENTSSPLTPDDEGVLVESLEEFVAAAKPGAILLIPQQGLFISSTSSFASGDNYHGENEYVGWDYIDYETNLVIRNIDELTIRGVDGKMGRILSDNPYAFVLCFENCSNIRIENVTAGHDVSGMCSGGVYNFRDCKEISISSCELFGCGTEGLAMQDVNGFSMEDSSIYECTYAIMSLLDCNNLRFSNIAFHHTGTYSDMVRITEGRRIIFEGCEFYNNYSNIASDYEARFFGVDDLSQEIQIKNCAFMDNMLPYLTSSQTVTFFDCSFDNNEFDENGLLVEDGVWLPNSPGYGEDSVSPGGAHRYVNFRQGYADEYLSNIILRDDGTFTFNINLLERMGYLSGSYVMDGSMLRLIVSERDFLGYTGDDIDEFIFTIDEDTLIYATGRPISDVFDGERFTLE